MHWLNEALPADTSIFLVKVEAYQIGESLPAPLFSVVAGPTPEARQIGTQKKVMAQRNLLLLEFWEQLLERAKEKTQLHARISPSKDHWISAGGGKSGLAFSYVILRNEARIELYIDTTDADKNESIFNELSSKSEEIERAYGEPLEWDRLPGRRASRIHHTFKNGGLADTERWAAIQSAMVDAMVRLEQALKPHLRSLPY